ncbi:MAG TPA: hypothetical protein VGN90_13965 [Pyrinomonadaceae bacterium]|nr:hypothetical protein [Pyrinomonadaceae bacterium]
MPTQSAGCPDTLNGGRVQFWGMRVRLGGVRGGIVGSGLHFLDLG